MHRSTPPRKIPARAATVRGRTGSTVAACATWSAARPPELTATRDGHLQRLAIAAQGEGHAGPGRSAEPRHRAVDPEICDRYAVDGVEQAVATIACATPVRQRTPDKLPGEGAGSINLGLVPGKARAGEHVRAAMPRPCRPRMTSVRAAVQRARPAGSGRGSPGASRGLIPYGAAGASRMGAAFAPAPRTDSAHDGIGADRDQPPP